MSQGANSLVREARDEGQFLLATLPPSKRHIRLALGIIVALIVTFFVMAPFGKIKLPQLGAFYPVLLTVEITNDIITSALLFSQFFVVGRTALFVLAMTYLFTGFMMIPFMLTFPGAFSPTGLLGAQVQSAAYIAFLYRAGASLGVIAYALLKDVGSPTDIISRRSPSVVIIWSIAVVIAIVCGLTWFIIAEDTLLPAMLIDNVRVNPVVLAGSGVILVSLNVIAIALLWRRGRSVLDLWILVMCCAWLLTPAMSGWFAGGRYSLGWYGARCYEAIAAVVVLLALLSETTALYAKLARSVARERGARTARQMTGDAVSASIAHEIRQPLAGIKASANAALRWIDRAAPNLDAAKTAINRILADGHRADEVIENIRALFKQAAPTSTSIDVNELVRRVLTTVDADLRAQGVAVSTELSERLPPLAANQTQLEEVFLNLITNAIEAMDSVADRDRLLCIRSDLIQESSTILVTVEDTGTGIDGKDKERMFEPFFTTKSEGTGIGLFICRAIVESHGGNLHAFANKPHGMIFHVALPNSSS
jgi:signal transduction histidine kinase